MSTIPQEHVEVLNRLHVSAIYEPVLVAVFGVPQRVLDELRKTSLVTIDLQGVWRITPAGEAARTVAA
jgi:hypothetical protein